METMKLCTKCGIEQHYTEFYRRARRPKSNPEARDGQCRTCTKKQADDWRRNNPERFTQTRWAREIKKKYGITTDDYYRMLEEQGGKCAGCRGDNPGRHGRVFAVDHCHATGRVRGLLCESCNLSLGRMGEDGDKIRGLAAYADRTCRLDDQ